MEAQRSDMVRDWLAKWNTSSTSEALNAEQEKAGLVPTQQGVRSGSDGTKNVPRMTDATSYIVPLDERVINIPHDKKKIPSHGRNKSQTSLLLEYFEASKSGVNGGRPSVRVKVIPSSKQKNKFSSHDAVQTNGIGMDRKPSYSRRISLGSKSSEREGRTPPIKGTGVSQSSESNPSGRPPPVEVEILNDGGSDLSNNNSRIPRDLRYLSIIPSEVSSIPPNSLYDASETNERPNSPLIEKTTKSVTDEHLHAPQSRDRSRSISRERIIQKVTENLYRQRRERQVEDNLNKMPIKNIREHSSAHHIMDTPINAASGFPSSSPNSDPASYRARRRFKTSPKLLEAVDHTARRLMPPEIEQIDSGYGVGHIRDLERKEPQYAGGLLTADGLRDHDSQHNDRTSKEKRKKGTIESNPSVGKGFAAYSQGITPRADVTIPGDTSRQLPTLDERSSHKTTQEARSSHESSAGGFLRFEEGHSLGGPESLPRESSPPSGETPSQLEKRLTSIEKTDTAISIQRHSRPSLEPSSIQDATASSKLTKRLSEFFPEDEHGPYSDWEIYEISSLLTRLNSSWAKIPRTYIVLRTIGCLSLMHTFVDLGFSDYWFPITPRSLPDNLSPKNRSDFVLAQNLVLTASMNLEKGEGGKHCTFRRNESLPFERKGVLGSGGFGQVDRVLSLISSRDYARKRVPKTAAFNGRGVDAQKSFVKEIEILKRLKHRHVVEFVGSYTDHRYIGLIMSPVVEMDLSAYLALTETTNSKLPELRTFFGCLTRALQFLHEQNIRHKDIKPGNILVDCGNVLFTDFGLSFDFTEASRSTTVGMANGMSPRYSAPEVMMAEPRSTSSDIWSLGVVFLEMVTVLKGRSVEHMKTYFEENGTKDWRISKNNDALEKLIQELSGAGKKSDSRVLEWIEEMLYTEPKMRPTAASLATMITHPDKLRGENGGFCGICCLSPDDSFSETSDGYSDAGDY